MQWEALAKVILKWAQGSGPRAPLRPPRLYAGHSLSSSEVEQTPAATPGGDIDSVWTMLRCWERLTELEQHRYSAWYSMPYTQALSLTDPA